MTGHSKSFGLNPGTGSSFNCATLPTERQINTVRPTTRTGITTSQVRLIGERVCQNSNTTPLTTVAIRALLTICQDGNIECSLLTDEFDMARSSDNIRFQPYFSKRIFVHHSQ